MGNEIKLAVAMFAMGFMTAKWSTAAMWAALTVAGFCSAFAVVWILHDFIGRR